MASELIERTMYNGAYQVIHNPLAKGRAPRYKVNDTLKPPGVTTILGKTLSKDLMQWAVDCCTAYLRTKLPIITEQDLVDGALAYTVKRDFGANTGTEAHAMVEDYLKGKKQKSGGSQEARNAYGAFVGWFEDITPTVINVEEVIYSPTLGYSGTYDAMLEIDGKVHLTDYKTTNSSRKAPNGVYPENFLQLGAYALAHEEQRAYEEAHGGTKLLQIEELTIISCQKTGVLNVISASDVGLAVQDCMDMWRAIMALYNFMQVTTKRLGGR